MIFMVPQQTLSSKIADFIVLTRKPSSNVQNDFPAGAAGLAQFVGGPGLGKGKLLLDDHL